MKHKITYKYTPPYQKKYYYKVIQEQKRNAIHQRKDRSSSILHTTRTNHIIQTQKLRKHTQQIRKTGSSRPSRKHILRMFFNIFRHI